MSQKIPAFAIVGHPNKGKSSIVSTLSHNPEINVSPISGTTEHNHDYPMEVDGQELYRLIDTPGFQRARAAMDWMQRHSKSEGDHPMVVRQFVEKHKEGERFKAECELLSPILDGAGILYVIDGSTPYGAEYYAEMEILRWTGQPSMALINQIGPAEFFDDWQLALSQYFKIVRSFNAQTASFDRQIQLLTGFAELSEDFYQPLQQAASLLKTQRQMTIDQACYRIVEMIISMTSTSVNSSIRDESDQAAIDLATDSYKEKLMLMESAARNDIEQLFNYQRLARDESTLSILSDDLFSEQTWKLFGLTRDQLVTTGIIGGAAGGSILDIGSGGLTMFLGSGLGAIVGGASAWLGSKQLIGIKILGLPMGGSEVIVGPVSNINFPWVLLGRAVTHLRHICNRTHAQRGQLQINHSEQNNLVSSLSVAQRKSLETVFSKARKGDPITPAKTDQITKLVSSIVS